MQFSVHWIDLEREPQCASDPRYPHGVTVNGAGDRPGCWAELPYPAQRCGYYSVECRTCGATALVTTAGRPDDPKALRVPCKPVARA